ncbi:toprim domain-containing protein [Enemella evansiae]|uniref:toprim domain-containing protein n=1 Tax=Enemella evansiae TaxID=2016499 RepID=UPI001595ED0D|nr:toprim domain-containing protein [Enemella evansiae]
MDQHNSAIRAAVAAADRFYRNHLTGSWAAAMLTERQLPATALGFGYAPPGWSTTTEHLQQQGLSAAVLQEAGISRRSSTGQLIDAIRDRVTVTISDTDGPVGFTARRREDAEGPKWLNTATSPIWHKQALLLTDDRGVDPSASAMPIVAEGAADVAAIRAVSERIHCYAASPCGTALTEQHVDELYRRHPRGPVALAFDGDDAGRQAALHAWDTLTSRPGFGNRQLLVVDLPSGQDPADLVAAGAGDELRRRLVTARPLAELVADLRTSGIHATDHALRAIATAERVVGTDWDRLHPASRQRYVDHLAGRLGLERSTIQQIVADHISHGCAAPAPSPAPAHRPDPPASAARARPPTGVAAAPVRGR